MNKEEHVRHWLESSKEAGICYLSCQGKHYSLSLFALHLTLEKLFKALKPERSAKSKCFSNRRTFPGLYSKTTG